MPPTSAEQRGGGGGGGAVAACAAAASPVAAWELPIRPTPEQGYVKSLGWQSLPRSADVLVSAVAAALVSLEAPFALHEGEGRFVVQPVKHATDACVDGSPNRRPSLLTTP